MGGEWRRRQGHAGRRDSKSFAELIETETSRNLVRVFFLRETMKGLKKGQSGIRRVHVIGAGAMGGDIAAWAAREGFDVTLGDIDAKPDRQGDQGRDEDADRHAQGPDQDPRRARPAGARPRRLRHRTAPISSSRRHRKSSTSSGSIYADIEPRLKEGALLATNTSALPLDDLAAGLKDPSRLVGLHFFNPVSRMQLIEIVRHDRINPETERRATAFAVELSRLPAPVASRPGFLVVVRPADVEAVVDDQAPDELTPGTGHHAGLLPVEAEPLVAGDRGDERGHT